jgi:starvation-inducible DNA-binding protein
MIPKIGIDEKHMEKSIELLSIVLADEMTLYIKTRKFHWNVAGESFMELHKLFEGQYSGLEVIIDQVAERINKLGGKAIGTMNEFTLLSRIVEHPNKYPIQKAMISELLSDHEMIISEIRKDIDVCAQETHDAGSADLLTKILQEHETNAWVLRRYLS